MILEIRSERYTVVPAHMDLAMVVSRVRPASINWRLSVNRCIQDPPSGEPLAITISSEPGCPTIGISLSTEMPIPADGSRLQWKCLSKPVFSLRIIICPPILTKPRNNGWTTQNAKESRPPLKSRSCESWICKSSISLYFKGVEKWEGQDTNGHK